MLLLERRGSSFPEPPLKEIPGVQPQRESDV